MMDQPEGHFLRILFDRLAAEGLGYAVMRNHATLPASAGGSDLDLIVPAAQGKHAREALLAAVDRAGGTCVGVVETMGFLKVCAMGRTPDSDGRRWWGLCIDVNYGLFYDGLSLLAEDAVFPIQGHGDIRAFEDDFADLFGGLKEILHNRKLPERFVAGSLSVALHRWHEARAMLAPMGSEALSAYKELLLSGRAAGDAAGCERIVRELKKHAFRQRPTRSLVGACKYRFSKVRRYWQPSGMTIAVLGVDGAGKSTTIEAILPVLRDVTHNAVTIQHLRPEILPPLARLRGGEKSAGGPVTNPHHARPSGTLGSMLRLLYLTADYVLGYWLWTRPKVAKQPCFVIFDRYAYDLRLDPARFRIALPPSVIRCFSAAAPTPDLVLCLLGDPERIAARKAELSVPETARQIASLQQLASQEKNAVTVRTDGSVAESRDGALQAIFDMLVARRARTPS